MAPVGNQMGEPAPQDDMMGGGMPQGNIPMGDEQGADMNGFGDEPQGGSQFDTNFDAGVEADEDTDPKKYIQQLTGKLSTTLNSYNSENGDDEGLNKYVAKMIVKASTKNMDDTQKKEIIKAINTSENPEPVDDEQDMNDEPDMNDNGGDMMPQDTDMSGETPIQERLITKAQLRERAKRRKNKD